MIQYDWLKVCHFDRPFFYFHKSHEKNWSKYPASIFGSYIEEVGWNPTWAMYLDEFGSLPKEDDFWEANEEEDFEDFLYRG